MYKLYETPGTALFLCTNKEQREEHVNVCCQEKDVSYKMHKANLAQVIKEEADNIKSCRTNKHGKAFCRKIVI